jgi:hypothetical protein
LLMLFAHPGRLSPSPQQVPTHLFTQLKCNVSKLFLLSPFSTYRIDFLSGAPAAPCVYFY